MGCLSTKAAWHDVHSMRTTIAADFHPIALVRRVKPLHGFVFFYVIPKNPFRNRKIKQGIIDADIMGAISIGSKFKFIMKEVLL